MLSSIRENRIRRNELYEITLQISEEEYFNVYDDISIIAAKEILDNHLTYHQDDGRPKNIDIKHNKNGHIVNITADLHYLGNNHSEQSRTPDILNFTRKNTDQK